MAKLVEPLDDFTKVFYIEFKNEAEEEAAGGPSCIYEYEPFIRYLSRFDDQYSYYVEYSVQRSIFGRVVYTYTVYILENK